MLWSEQIPTSAPLLRVYLFGECVLERLVAGSEEAGQTPRYARVSNDEWKGRGPALALLKLLLCRHHRRAMKDELVAALWPEPDEDEEEKRLKNADRALDAAVSVLRKVLGTPDGSSLLTTTSCGDGTIYKLSGQECIWVDADAFEQCTQKALKATHMQEAIPLWESAYQLTRRGEFLEEDRYRDWATSRRDALAGRIGTCVYALADRYIQQQRLDQAQGLLWEVVEDHPDDEDALYRLLLLLERQERYQAAWQLYQRAKESTARESLSLAPRIKTLAKRIATKQAAQEPPTIERALTFPHPTVVVASTNGLSVDCATWFAVRQAEIIDMVEQWKGHALHCDELQVQLLPLFGVLNERQPGYSPDAHTYSRRQVLLGIASLALAMLASGRNTDRLALFAEEFLPQCTAAIMACRHLMKGQDFFQAEAILTQYLPALEALVKEHSPYQPVAARLVMQHDKLTGILAGHRLHWVEAEHYHSHAVQFSHLAQDQNFQAMARVELASYLYHRNPAQGPAKALQIFQEVDAFIQNCSSLTQSNFHMKRAFSYAQCGQAQEAQESLDAAHKYFPAHLDDDPAFLYLDLGGSNLFLWEGMTRLELARRGLSPSQEAWDAFAPVENISSNMLTSERIRIEIINYQTTTAIIMQDLDLFYPYLQKGIEGAERLGSARRRQEAASNYWQARKLWPHEKRIREMAELFIPPGSEREVLA
jgi:DNA-binding SARP family transcriptional activator